MKYCIGILCLLACLTGAKCPTLASAASETHCVRKHCDGGKCPLKKQEQAQPATQPEHVPAAPVVTMPEDAPAFPWFGVLASAGVVGLVSLVGSAGVSAYREIKGIK